MDERINSCTRVSCSMASRLMRGRRVEMQRVDALVLEKTHSSTFVPDIHGYCSFGILMDYTPVGTLYDYVTGMRLAGGGSTLPPVDRLRLHYTLLPV